MFDNINPVDACLALIDLILECKELEMPMCDDNYIRWLVTTEVSEQWVRKYDGQDLLLERRPASRPVPANLEGIRRIMFTEYVEKRSKLTDKQRRLGEKVKTYRQAKEIGSSANPSTCFTTML